MGKTCKIIKSEVKQIFENVYEDLREEEKKLTKEEKNTLRCFLEKIGKANVHGYCHILIKRFIKKIIYSREGGDKDLHDIKNVSDFPSSSH
jgi:hypothetical protein